MRSLDLALRPKTNCHDEIMRLGSNGRNSNLISEYMMITIIFMIKVMLIKKYIYE